RRVIGIGVVAQRFDPVDHLLRPVLPPHIERLALRFARLGDQRGGIGRGEQGRAGDRGERRGFGVGLLIAGRCTGEREQGRPRRAGGDRGGERHGRRLRDRDADRLRGGRGRRVGTNRYRRLGGRLHGRLHIDNRLDRRSTGRFSLRHRRGGDGNRR